MEETDFADKKQNDKPWLFKKGQSGNPLGRPKGTFSLKTYAQNYLKDLTGEEKEEFMNGLPKEIIWKMAEGNPANATDLTSKGEKIIVMPAELIKKNDTTPNPENSSTGQTQI